MSDIPGTVPLPPAVKKDDEGVTFEFGREEVKVPPLSFYALKKCWEEMTRAASTPSVIERVDAVLNIVSAALADTPNPLTNEDLSKKLSPKNWPHLTLAYGELLVMSGLIEASELIPKPLPEEPTDPNLQGGGGKQDSGSEQASSTSSSSATDDLAQNQLSPQVMVNGPTSIQ